MASIFLSHSSIDKPAIRELAADLRSRGHTVWFDEQNIDVGHSIPAKIEEALQEAEFIGVWITKNSNSSQWVKAELNARITTEISSGMVSVLPLLAEKVAMPYWLKDKKRADFYLGYDIGLGQLLKALNQSSSSSEKNDYVTQGTLEFLDNLSEEKIQIPLHEQPIFLIETLRKMPRSGKYLRLDNFEPKLHVRTVYEHILSIAHTADCLFSTGSDLPRSETIELARLIAFHELNEVFLGDIPSYTTLRLSKLGRIDIEAGRILAKIENREEITNSFIAMFLGERESESLQRVNRLKAANDKVYKFFTVLDKIDPIIAVWRYIFIYRDFLSDDEMRNFIKHMIDFFQNPKVSELIIDLDADPRFLKMVNALQTTANARNYYGSRDFFGRTDIDFGFKPSIVKDIIENFLYSEVSQIEPKLFKSK